MSLTIRTRPLATSVADGSPLGRLFVSQFGLLQALHPMDCWLAGLQQGDVYEEIARHGHIDAKPPAPAPSLRRAFRWPMQDAMGTALISGFSLRPPTGEAGAWAQAEVQACLLTIVHAVALHVYLHHTRRQLQRLLRQGANDPLTGLLNRAGFDHAVSQSDLTSGEAAVAYLDVDGLKSINDACGHAAGDEVLRRTAGAMRATVRKDDHVARLGGDEFGIVLSRAGLADAAALKDRLHAALAAVGVHASIGVALKSEAGCLRKAVELADARMYQEKRARKASWADRIPPPGLMLNPMPPRQVPRNI